MAIYHFNAKTIGRSQGRSATGAAAYRAGVRIEDARTGLIFDYTRKRGVDGAEILTPDGYALDRATLWNTVERCEKRVDAQLAREIEVALPRELTPEQMRGLVRRFASDCFVAAGMVADIAFHHLAGSNPHAHILLTLRDWQGGAFGLKRREWNERALCESWRTAWADHANAALEQAGHAARIDPRTLVEQAAEAGHAGRYSEASALDRQPTIHERGNPAAIAHNAQVRDANTARLADWTAIEQAPAQNGGPMPAVTDAALVTNAAKRAASDAAFVQAMTGRRDQVASRWRYYDQRVCEAAEWLRNHSDEEARRFAARDRLALGVHAARARRYDWVTEHPRPAWWRFWQRPRWVRERARMLAQVEEAKLLAARAARKASPAAITAWRQTYAEHRAEHAEALRQRQQLALLPSEQDELERAQEARSTLARSARARAPTPPVTRAMDDPPPSRPRPGRRR